MLPVEDDYTREDRALKGGTLPLRELDRIDEYRGFNMMIVSDNGIEITSNAILAWQEKRSVLWHFIILGRPQKKGLVESFDGRFWDKCLNERLFRNIAHARIGHRDLACRLQCR